MTPRPTIPLPGLTSHTATSPCPSHPWTLLSSQFGPAAANVTSAQLACLYLIFSEDAPEQVPQSHHCQSPRPPRNRAFLLILSICPTLLLLIPDCSDAHNHLLCPYVSKKEANQMISPSTTPSPHPCCYFGLNLHTAQDL